GGGGGIRQYRVTTYTKLGISLEELFLQFRQLSFFRLITIIGKKTREVKDFRNFFLGKKPAG
ncbi:MAG: hypothetical protein FWG66_00185, partial [Spirochaetes bacterium]|nr:hypothetical protein [Spirochaetota bacterium]